MKKFLLIAIFFLTLLPVIGDGGYSRLSAQRMAFEDGSWWLPDVEVNGEKKETCDICGETYDANDPSSHECTVNVNTVVRQSTLIVMIITWKPFILILLMVPIVLSAILN